MPLANDRHDRDHAHDDTRKVTKAPTAPNAAPAAARLSVAGPGLPASAIAAIRDPGRASMPAVTPDMDYRLERS